MDTDIKALIFIEHFDRLLEPWTGNHHLGCPHDALAVALNTGYIRCVTTAYIVASNNQSYFSFATFFLDGCRAGDARKTKRNYC